METNKTIHLCNFQATDTSTQDSIQAISFSQISTSRKRARNGQNTWAKKERSISWTLDYESYNKNHNQTKKI